MTTCSEKSCSYQGWAANSTPGVYRCHLSVFTGLENTPRVVRANTGKLNFFLL